MISHIRNDNKNDRIYSTLIPLQLPNGQILRHQLYIRFIGKKTDLWFFGCGLGDQACITQVGNAFLELVDEGLDPDLGRVMISIGYGPTAFMSYKGDINVRWAWGDPANPSWMNEYLRNTRVKPDVYLCASEIIMEQLQETNIPAVYFPAGAGSEFKPLNLEREGLGYAGLNTKTPEMTHAILGPALKRELDWISKDPNADFKTLPELNEWYNTKQILFGMDLPGREELGVVLNRVYETLASGTPLIQYRNKNINKELGFNYPWQSSSYDETEATIDTILDDYDKILEDIQIMSHIIRTQHSYRCRLEDILIPMLEEIT